MVRRTPAQYDWPTCSFDETILPASPRRITSPRRKKIQFVVIHHMAMVGRGDGSANDACVRAWKTREASAHYGVDGKFVRQFVWDSNEAWATADSLGNQAGISIEHANSTAGPKWLVSDETWKTGAKLVAYLHKLYDLGRPVAGKTLRRHKDFSSTACPGPYLGGSHFDEYVAEAQRVYDSIDEEPTVPAPSKRTPADILDLDDWKLTPPVGRPDEVKQPRLSEFQAKPYFWADGDGVRFRAHVGGATTSGSKYPRSELREMNGSRLAAWTNKAGFHEMRVEQAIIATPKVKPHVVAGQIHNGDDDVVMIRLEGKKLFVESGGNRVGDYLDVNYVLGTRFRIRIAAAPGGIRIAYNETKFVDLPKKVASGAYFKAGCYTQAYARQKVVVNGATLRVPDDTYGEVVIYKLTVTHK